MSNEEFENIMIDIYCVMKGRGYKFIKIDHDEKDFEEEIVESLRLTTRAMNGMRREKIFTLDQLSKFLQGNISVRNIGVNSIADIKANLIRWHMTRNIENGFPPLHGVKLTYGEG